MPATIHEFSFLQNSSTKWPQFIFLDTNFLLDCLIPWSKTSSRYLRAQDSIKLLNTLTAKAKNGETCVFTDDWALNEFFMHIVNEMAWVELKATPKFSNHMPQYTKEKKKNVPIALLKDHPELLNKFFPVLEQYYEKIKFIPVEILSPEALSITQSGASSISDEAIKNIRDYQLLPADALHISIALRAGIKDIISNDSDLYSVDNITLYTAKKGTNKCRVCP